MKGVSHCHISLHHLIKLLYSAVRVFYWTSFRENAADISHIPQVEKRPQESLSHSTSSTIQQLLHFKEHILSA